MKILVLGDIHGRTIWKDIIEKENPDLVIFLGDYVSTHGFETAKEQIENLEDILQYKEQNPNTTILLRGNHDIQHLGYYWAACSGLDREVLDKMSQSEFKERFLNLTQWIYIDKNLKTLFSHAGISSRWLQHVEKYLVRTRNEQYDNGTIDQDVILELINTVEPCELFGFSPDSPFDVYGDSPTQPSTWIRPGTLCMCNIIGYDQVVGHTPQRNISKMAQSTKGKQTIWLCDSLGFENYLIIEDGEFKPKNYKKDKLEIL